MYRSCLVVLALLFLNVSCSAEADSPDAAQTAAPRSVILFVADGAGPAHFTMARELARSMGLRDALYLDPYLVGTVRTHSAKERVTDSASSATTYATGYKTYNGAIGVDTLQQPLRTVLEAAETAGRATGLVATSRITHATPASFASHVASRGMEDEIASQMIEQDVDVILGGGRQHFVSGDGMREDGRDLLSEASDMGYHVVSDATGLAGVDEAPVLGLFADSHMPYEIDTPSNDALDLAAMTRKAIDLLKDDPEGFFLLVEGSRVDHASHDNDAAAALRDLIAYDDAFEVARQFAEEDGETLILATSDHETGGLTAGRSMPPDDIGERNMSAPTYWQSLYGSGVYDWRPSVLAGVSSSTIELAARLEAGADPRTVLQEDAGLEDVTSDELAALRVAGQEGGLVRVLGEIIARRAIVGFTTSGHTAVDVNLYAFGPGSEVLRGNVDNTDVGSRLFEALGLEKGSAAVNP